MAAKRPNILFFFTDDQRFDTIHALGNDAIQTPNLDRLVERGTTFTHAHIPSGTSGAVCMPSRAMLHTGRTLFHIDRQGQQIPEEHTTLGEAFQAAGYRTFGAGKWHNGSSSFARSFSDGDEIFFGGMYDHWNVPAHHYDTTGKYEARLPYIRNFLEKREVRYHSADHITAGKHSSELLCEAAAKWLTSYNSDAPWMTYISFLAPHDPRSMPQRFLDMYDPDEVELPPNFMGGHPFDNGALHIRDEELAAFPRNPGEVRTHIAEYYAMITHLDDELGKVMQMLEDAGQIENTLIVFAGDNGLAVGQHGLMGKQNHYEHSIRVPLIFAGPGIPQGETRDTYAYLLDIFPTLCELTGTPIPASVEGKSLAPALKDNSVSIRDTLYFAYTSTMRSVRDRTHKLIETRTDETAVTQLFDTVADPWELTNLAACPEHAGTVETLRKELFAFRDAWDDRAHPMGETFWKHFEQIPTGEAI